MLGCSTVILFRIMISIQNLKLFRSIMVISDDDIEYFLLHIEIKVTAVTAIERILL